jgi:hypothetical protein
VTPGEKRARSEKRRPFNGKSFRERSSRRVETALGLVSTIAGALDTVRLS